MKSKKMTTIFTAESQSVEQRKPRLPRKQRATSETLPPLRLTERDKDILLAIYQHRTLTTAQIDRLLFGGTGTGPRKPRCLLRMKLLYHHGFLYRKELPIYTEGGLPYLYLFDAKGAVVVATLLDSEIEEREWTPWAE